MNTARALLPLLLAALPALAQQQDDPLKSAACARALQQLQAAREAKGAPEAVAALRAEAAATCLGTAAPAARPGGGAQPPVAVPPPRIEPPRGAAPLPAPAAAPPPVAIERAPLPALCDAGGCWIQDGSHLRHVPPTLVGPGGRCTLQGGLVYCP